MLIQHADKKNNQKTQKKSQKKVYIPQQSKRLKYYNFITVLLTKGVKF